MTTEVIIPVETDSHNPNTYDLKISIKDNVVCFQLESPYRIVDVRKEYVEKFLRVFKATE